MGISFSPLVTAIYGAEYWLAPSDKLPHGPAHSLINWPLPAIAIVLFAACVGALYMTRRSTRCAIP